MLKEMEMKYQFTLLKILNKPNELIFIILACHKAFGNVCDTLVSLKIPLESIKNGIKESCVSECAFPSQLFFYDCDMPLASY